MSRVLAVDPGDVWIGLAVSDPTGTIARPLQVLRHRSRAEDAAAIARIAEEQGASRIVVGVPYNVEGLPGPQARKVLRLIEALRAETDLPVEPWDESGSTQAVTHPGEKGQNRHARAAAAILQDYLQAHAA